jgi:hypothetical protein
MATKDEITKLIKDEYSKPIWRAEYRILHPAEISPIDAKELDRKHKKLIKKIKPKFTITITLD